jgi:Ca2+-binding EF-hand superfamily protein
MGVYDASMTTYEPTPVLRRKLDRAFGHVDTDGNGYVEYDDIVALAARLMDGFDEPADGPKGRALTDAFHTFWEALISAIDLDGDRRIDPHEWSVGMTGAFVEQDGGFDAALRPAAQAVVALADTDDDGTISPAEFRTFQQAFGTSERDADTGFARLDADGDGSLTTDEIVEASRQYYTGSEEAPGDWLFGPL